MPGVVFSGLADYSAQGSPHPRKLNEAAEGEHLQAHRVGCNTCPTGPEPLRWDLRHVGHSPTLAGYGLDAVSEDRNKVFHRRPDSASSLYRVELRDWTSVSYQGFTPQSPRRTGRAPRDATQLYAEEHDGWLGRPLRPAGEAGFTGCSPHAVGVRNVLRL
jgi:hypothetical protein